MSALMEFSIIPLDKEKNMSPYVARVTALIKQSGLPHQLGPMSGCVEGEWEDLLALATRCFKDIAQDSRHILVDMRISYRAEQKNRLKM